VKVGDRPWGIALSPDGKWLYTANGPSNDVSVVDPETLSVVGKIKVGDRPWGVVVAPTPKR
jgi:YVTN family beta-propeller protein